MPDDEPEVVEKSILIRAGFVGNAKLVLFENSSLSLSLKSGCISSGSFELGVVRLAPSSALVLSES